MGDGHGRHGLHAQVPGPVPGRVRGPEDRLVRNLLPEKQAGSEDRALGGPQGAQGRRNAEQPCQEIPDGSGGARRHQVGGNRQGGPFPGGLNVVFKPSVFFEALTSPAFIEGVKITITLTVVAMAFGLALGLVVALLRASPWAPLRALAWGYIWVFRAIPALVWLLFVWDALPQLLPVFKGDWFSAFAAATIALAMNEAAYAAEVFRGGLLSIDDGQRLAARALGMSPSKVFSKVIAPQLIRVTIPPLSHDFITLLKLTRLA